MKRRLAIALLLAALVFVLYRKVTRLWWTYDDAYTLHLVTTYALADSFANPAMWPQKLFTPLVTTAFEAQLVAFGLEPSRWYVVHLILLFATALALYATLRLWFSIAASLTAAILFVTGVPMCALIAVLGGTHYLQAILLGCLSTILFVRGRKYESSLLYLLAMLAKETVVPLVVLLAFLPNTKRRDLAPHAIAVGIYLLWRRAVIGTILGGYGWAIAPGEWPRLIASLPMKIVRNCAGAGLAAGIVLLLVTAIGGAIAARRNIVLFLVALALAAGPILPVSKEMQRRYALMPWLVWSIAFAAGTDRFGVRRPQSPLSGREPQLALRRDKAATAVAALQILACVAAIAANRQEWSHEFAKTQRMSDEARFFFHMPPDGLLRAPTVPPAAMGELAWLQSFAGRPTGASWFFDDYFLCTGRTNGKRMWEYVPSRRGVVEIKPPGCPAYRRDVPLTWRFRYRDGSLFWKLGPYPNGKYHVLLGDGLQAFDVPREDAFRLPDIPGLTVRLRYDSPDGWTTYSRPIELRFR